VDKLSKGFLTRDLPSLADYLEVEELSLELMEVPNATHVSEIGKVPVINSEL
jgi:hypothetical protein